MSNIRTLVWLRNDLRLADNAALFHAIEDGKALAIYIWDERSDFEYKPLGQASKQWLYHSLDSLKQSLGDSLLIVPCSSEQSKLELLQQVCEQYDLNQIYWNRAYEPWRILEDTEIKSSLNSQSNPSLQVKSFKSNLLFEPWQILKDDQSPYKVFSAFYKKAQKVDGFAIAPPLPKISSDHANWIQVTGTKGSNSLKKIELLSSKPWSKSMMSNWHVGEEAAFDKLADFLTHKLRHYKEGRDYPELDAVSALSPHIHFGEISVGQIFYQANLKVNESQANNLEHFKRELCWREFSYYLLYHFNTMGTDNFQSKFDKFPWYSAKQKPEYFKAWSKGLTGYPIIDAGMRELWQTGYMHNRVRMIVASFLVKNLLIDWREGERWFWDCLVDADHANNVASWQWAAGSGADAAPYFRIFNPVTQGEKFDKQGHYTRRWVPELARLPNKYLHKPWEASIEILHEADVTLGSTYPKPIVDLKLSRQQALDAYQDLKA